MEKKRGLFFRRMLAVMLAFLLLPFGSLSRVEAAGTQSVSISVTYGQTQARSLAAILNQYRTSSGIATLLQYDYDLEAKAMQRAAEIALVYDNNIRPDGSFVLGVYGNDCVENIAYGTSAVETVCGSWMSDASGSNNILNPSYTALGVGHVTYNGNDYWVAAFSGTVTNTAATAANDTASTAWVSIDGTRISQQKLEGLSNPLYLGLGETKVLDNCRVTAQITGHMPQGEACPFSGNMYAVSANPQVVEVSGMTLRGIQYGSTSVTVSCGGFASSIPVTVQQNYSYNQLTIDPISDQFYTGYAVTPLLTVRYANMILTETVDYMAVFQNNVNIGTATVTIYGMGAYVGLQQTATFQISNGIGIGTATGALANATVPMIADQTYTGSQICPTVYVYVNGYLLREGIDYTLYYTNNINPGTAMVTINGLGTYSGTRTISFRIVGPSVASATIAAIPDQLYTGLEIRPTVTVTMDNVTLQANVDYYVSYSNNRNVGTATVTISGRGRYTGTKTTNFRILGKDISNTTVSSIANQRYTGDEIRPTVTVKIGNTVLTKNVDYTLTYKNNINPGTASIVITGAGSYSGSKTVTFKITQMSIADATVKVSNQTYDGEAKKPDVTVKLDGEVLDGDDDYAVEYQNNKKPGKATVIITGEGFYTGTKKATFIIKPKKATLSSVKANGKNASLVWKKDANVTGYELYRSKKKASGYSRIASFSSNKTTACTNTNLSAATYYYKVRSYILIDGKKYYGAYSNIKKVTIK